MSFVIRMALREIRASWQRLLFFFVCIAVGVASIVAIRSVIQSVRQGLTREARAMTGADVVVRSDRPLGDAIRAAVERERTSGRVSIVSEAVELVTMVRPTAVPTTRMVELRAVEATFPLYGTMTLQGKAYSHELLRDHGVLVRPELLAQLDLRVGDDLLIGTQAFHIRGVIESEPGRNLGAFSAGLASLHRLCGSAVDRSALVRQPRLASVAAAGPEPATTARAEIRASRWQPSCEGVRQRLRRCAFVSPERGTDEPEPYASRELPESRRARGSHPWRHRRLERHACVRAAEGPQHRDPEVRRRAHRAQVLAIYLTQVVLLGARGQRARRRDCRARVAALPVFVGDLAALLQVDYGLTMARGRSRVWPIGLLVSLLFSVVPLLEVRHVKPSLLLRQDVPALPQFDWLKWIVAVAVGGGAGRRRGVAGGIAAGRSAAVGAVSSRVTFVLHLAGVVLIRAVQPLRYSRSFALAPGGAARGASRQPDADHPAGGRPRHVLHPRRPDAAGQPAAGLRGAGR